MRTGLFGKCLKFSEGADLVTLYPKYLKTYPNMHTPFPLHISLKGLERGFPVHRHDYMEFSYVVEGSGAEKINGVVHPMLPGTFTFIFPYQIHELFTDPGSRLVLYNCMFSMDLLAGSGIGESFGGLSDSGEQPVSYAQFQGAEREAMHALVDEIYREYSGAGLWRETLIRAKLLEALIRFGRHRERAGRASAAADALAAADAPSADAAGRGAYPAAARPAGAAAAQQTIGPDSAAWPIVRFIHLHYREELQLSDLAKRFSMSASRISEVIKQATGQTFVHLLHDLRIRHASSLLVSTEMSVMDIALDVGYGSYKTFARIFRETKGVVPTEYRKLKLRSAAAANGK